MTINLSLPSTNDETVDRVLRVLTNGLRPLFSGLFSDVLELEVSRDAALVGPAGYVQFQVSAPLSRDILLTPGVINVIPHKFGKAPRGRLITKQNANATVWDTPLTAAFVATNPYGDASQFLCIECSAATTVSVVLF